MRLSWPLYTILKNIRQLETWLSCLLRYFFSLPEYQRNVLTREHALWAKDWNFAIVLKLIEFKFSKVGIHFLSIKSG